MFTSVCPTSNFTSSREKDEHLREVRVIIKVGKEGRIHYDKSMQIIKTDPDY